MAVWIVTGELGSGKTLVTVSRIQEALWNGCRVATNLDLNLDKLVSARHTHADVTRLPDWPKASDLEQLGHGYAGQRYDEKRFGLLVLDEVGTFINAREWGDADRQKLIRWLLHARKLRWHVYLIVQDISMIDKQVRSGLAEHVVRCKRLDRVNVPFISPITKALQLGPVRLPQIHMGVVRYGTKPDAPVVDRWVIYNGAQYHEAYDTAQKILGFNDGPATMLNPKTGPWMWPSPLRQDKLGRLTGWRFWGPSERENAHTDWRLQQLGYDHYKPIPSCAESWREFCERTERVLPEPSSGEALAVAA